MRNYKVLGGAIAIGLMAYGLYRGYVNIRKRTSIIATDVDGIPGMAFTVMGRSFSATVLEHDVIHDVVTERLQAIANGKDVPTKSGGVIRVHGRKAVFYVRCTDHTDRPQIARVFFSDLPLAQQNKETQANLLKHLEFLGLTPASEPSNFDITV